jgi:hypothetical protein
MHPVDLLVRSHNSPGPRVRTQGELEGEQVHFAEGALRHVDIVLLCVCRLIVGGVVLDAGGDAALLQALNIVPRKRPAEYRVFGESFESAPD